MAMMFSREDVTEKMKDLMIIGFHHGWSGSDRLSTSFRKNRLLLSMAVEGNRWDADLVLYGRPWGEKGAGLFEWIRHCPPCG